MRETHLVHPRTPHIVAYRTTLCGGLASSQMGQQAVSALPRRNEITPSALYTQPQVQKGSFFQQSAAAIATHPGRSAGGRGGVRHHTARLARKSALQPHGRKGALTTSSCVGRTTELFCRG